VVRSELTVLQVLQVAGDLAEQEGTELYSIALPRRGPATIYQTHPNAMHPVIAQISWTGRRWRLTRHAMKARYSTSFVNQVTKALRRWLERWARDYLEREG
jgi:hypothetical protein